MGQATPLDFASRTVLMRGEGLLFGRAGSKFAPPGKGQGRKRDWKRDFSGVGFWP